MTVVELNLLLSALFQTNMIVSQKLGIKCFIFKYIYIYIYINLKNMAVKNMNFLKYDRKQKIQNLKNMKVNN